MIFHWKGNWQCKVNFIHCFSFIFVLSALDHHRWTWRFINVTKSNLFNIAEKRNIYLFEMDLFNAMYVFLWILSTHKVGGWTLKEHLPCSKVFVFAPLNESMAIITPCSRWKCLFVFFACFLDFYLFLISSIYLLLIILQRDNHSFNLMWPFLFCSS